MLQDYCLFSSGGYIITPHFCGVLIFFDWYTRYIGRYFILEEGINTRPHEVPAYDWSQLPRYVSTMYISQEPDNKSFKTAHNYYLIN
jgi:hypothetical protein